jgi:hypothetical protein
MAATTAMVTARGVPSRTCDRAWWSERAVTTASSMVAGAPRAAATGSTPTSSMPVLISSPASPGLAPPTDVTVGLGSRSSPSVVTNPP